MHLHFQLVQQCDYIYQNKFFKCTYVHLCLFHLKLLQHAPVPFSNVLLTNNSTHPRTAKPFLRHAHYVAASRVRSLEGLQILKWNEDLISVNEDVQKHLDYLQKERTLHLCYTQLYNLEGVMKCVFLNTRSLHKHISDVQSSHNIKEADLVIVAEMQLKSSDVNTDYEIDNHQHILRNDQEYNGRTRPAHGIIGYVKDGI